MYLSKKKHLHRVVSIFIGIVFFATCICATPISASAATTRKSINGMLSNTDMYMQMKDNFFISPACARNSVLDIYNNGYRNGTNCQLYQLNYTFAQQFKVIRFGRDGYGPYFIIQKSASPNMVLDVSGGIVKNGQNIQLYKFNGTKAQQWYIKSAGNGYYYFVSRLNINYVMDVSGASSRNCTNIQLYKKNGTNAQKFSFNVCTHAHTHRVNRNIFTETGDLIWFSGTECMDCKQVLQYGTWTFPIDDSLIH